MTTLLGSRRPTPVEEHSVRELIVRIRWERAKKAFLGPESPARVAVEANETRLLEELHKRFGVHNITAHDLEWLIDCERSA